MPDGGDLVRAVADSPAAGRLKEAAGGYAAAQGRRLLASTGRRLGETSARLDGMEDADDGAVVGFVLKETVKGAVKDTVKGAVRDAVRGAARKATGGLAGRRGGGDANRTVTISESVDVGAPLPDTYDRWALLHESGGPAPDWRPRILWSTRGWRTRITQETEDERIVWAARGARGTARGVATFHELAGNLTRVLLVLEYRPGGLRGRAGTLWAAPARRVRRDLEDFRRSVMMRGGSAADRTR
ncbi:hypothetical protein GCM10010420_18250 [Streptomyces glaucosporus]|uniref:Cyclase n=1 Tax=Streptomyces glaucosporus TaxID=284044 RepID=A0ABP5V3L9_9ACTN